MTVFEVLRHFISPAFSQDISHENIYLNNLFLSVSLIRKIKNTAEKFGQSEITLQKAEQLLQEGSLHVGIVEQTELKFLIQMYLYNKTNEITLYRESKSEKKVCSIVEKRAEYLFENPHCFEIRQARAQAGKFLSNPQQQKFFHAYYRKSFNLQDTDTLWGWPKGTAKNLLDTFYKIIDQTLIDVHNQRKQDDRTNR